MNKERMLKLADAIEQSTLPVRFDMRFFVSSGGSLSVPKKLHCNTAYCIGGWACLLYGEKGSYIDEKSAMELLGISPAQSDKLFYNRGGYIREDDPSALNLITSREAVAAIRRMVREEEELVDWPDEGAEVDEQVEVEV